MEQHVSVRLPRVRMLFLGAGSGPVGVVWGVLFHKFPEPLHLQGASSHFPVLRIKAHKTIRVGQALWAPGSSGKQGLGKCLLPY